jgi:hypothetical protein
LARAASKIRIISREQRESTPSKKKKSGIIKAKELSDSELEELQSELEEHHQEVRPTNRRIIKERVDRGPTRFSTKRDGERLMGSVGVFF